jgi:hypothetical protein
MPIPHGAKCRLSWPITGIMLVNGHPKTAARERLAAANADNRRLYEGWSPWSGAIAPASRTCRITSTATERGPSSHTSAGSGTTGAGSRSTG